MIREHLVVVCFVALVIADLVFVLRGGSPTRPRILRGLAALAIFGALAGAMGWFFRGDSSYSVFKDVSVSYPDAGIGILFIALATLGCLCADSRK